MNKDIYALIVPKKEALTNLVFRFGDELPVGQVAQTEPDAYFRDGFVTAFAPFRADDYNNVTEFIYKHTDASGVARSFLNVAFPEVPWKEMSINDDLTMFFVEGTGFTEKFRKGFAVTVGQDQPRYGLIRFPSQRDASGDAEVIKAAVNAATTKGAITGAAAAALMMSAR